MRTKPQHLGVSEAKIRDRRWRGLQLEVRDFLGSELLYLALKILPHDARWVRVATSAMEYWSVPDA